MFFIKNFPLSLHSLLQDCLFGNSAVKAIGFLITLADIQAGVPDYKAATSRKVLGKVGKPCKKFRADIKQ